MCYILGNLWINSHCTCQVYSYSTGFIYPHTVYWYKRATWENMGPLFQACYSSRPAELRTIKGTANHHSELNMWDLNLSISETDAAVNQFQLGRMKAATAAIEEPQLPKWPVVTKDKCFSFFQTDLFWPFCFVTVVVVVSPVRFRRYSSAVNWRWLISKRRRINLPSETFSRKLPMTWQT